MEFLRNKQPRSVTLAHWNVHWHCALVHFETKSTVISHIYDFSLDFAKTYQKHWAFLVFYLAALGGGLLFYTNPNISCTEPSSSIHFIKVFHSLALVFKVPHCDIVAPNMNFPTGVRFICDKAVAFFPVHQPTWHIWLKYTRPPLRYTLT